MRTSNNGYTLCGKYWIEYRNFLGSIRGYWKSRPYDDFNSAIWRLDSGTKIVWMLCWEQRRFHLANVYYTSKGSRYGVYAKYTSVEKKLRKKLCDIGKADLY